jgi:phosphatidyl-myo-inositol dimannoside synthase
MKICLVTNDINPHVGLGRVVNSLADEFAIRGNTVGIIAPEGKILYDTLHVTLRIDFTHPVRSFNELLKIRKFVGPYDVIVAFDPRPVGILTHLACLGLNKKIIIQTLGTYALFEKNIFKNYLIAWVYKTSAKVFVINSFVKRCIEDSRKGFSFGSNLANVPVGVDTKLFYIHSDPSFLFGPQYILSVGAIKPRKGQLKSILAFIEIAPEFPNLNYVLVGDIDEQIEYIHQIRAAIEKAELTKRVHLIEKISDTELIDLYSGAYFFILTPTTTKEFIEGFGMVYLEAALCGIPSIGTWNTGAEAAIAHQRSGLLVSEQVEDIAEGMRFMLLNGNEREAYGLYARKRALMYDWKKIVDLYEKEILTIEI